MVRGRGVEGSGGGLHGRVRGSGRTARGRVRETPGFGRPFTNGGYISSCECIAPVLAQPCSRSSGTCTCVGGVDRRGIAQDASAMEADSLLKFGYPFEWPAGGGESKTGGWDRKGGAARNATPGSVEGFGRQIIPRRGKGFGRQGMKKRVSAAQTGAAEGLSERRRLHAQ